MFTHVVNMIVTVSYFGRVELWILKLRWYEFNNQQVTHAQGCYPQNFKSGVDELHCLRALRQSFRLDLKILGGSVWPPHVCKQASTILRASAASDSPSKCSSISLALQFSTLRHENHKRWFTCPSRFKMVGLQVERSWDVLVRCFARRFSAYSSPAKSYSSHRIDLKGTIFPTQHKIATDSWDTGTRWPASGQGLPRASAELESSSRPSGPRWCRTSCVWARPSQAVWGVGAMEKQQKNPDEMVGKSKTIKLYQVIFTYIYISYDVIVMSDLFVCLEDSWIEFPSIAIR